MLNRRTLFLSALVATSSGLARAAAPISTPLPGNQAPALGLSLPLSGVQAEIAQDLLGGYELAALASGGAFRLQVLDDTSKADVTALNVQTLAKDQRVLALSGIVGTPHAQAALPIAIEAGLPVVGIRSGAASLRNRQSGVFHLRSTYESELQRMASMLAGAGYQRAQIVFSKDSFGIESKDTLVQALGALGLSAPAPVAMERNGENMQEAIGQIARRCMVNEPVSTAIVLLVISGPAIAATQMLREQHRIILPVYAMSHVINRTLASKPMPAMAGFGVMLAFPLPRTSHESIAAKFRDTAERAGKRSLSDSPTAFEGFFYGSTFAQALQASGGSATRKDIISHLHEGLSVYGLPIHPNDLNEGYSYIDVAYKESKSGLLRT